MTLLVLVLPSLAASLTVDPSDPGAYATIEDAISDAVDGDTVSVTSGTYYECIDTSGKDLTLVGAGSSATTLDGASACTNAVLPMLTPRGQGYRFCTIWLVGSCSISPSRPLSSIAP